MTVVLTGDVHHTIGSSDQRFTDRSEITLATEYARIADRHGLKATLFLTGLAAVEDGVKASALFKMKNVEIGAHGWDALRPQWWHGLLSRLTGSPHGPPGLQRRMIQHTCTTIEQYTGQPARSWRNHAYRYDRHTPHLLAEAGTIVWSDEVQLDQYWLRRHSSGVVILPINTLPDHEYLYHGARTPESVAAEGHGPSYSPDVWCDRVCAQVETIVGAGGVATILAHPICMKIADDFATFDRLCAFLVNYPTLFASEVAERLCAR